MIDWDSCVLWLDSKYFSESYWWDRSKYRNDGVVHGAKWKADAFYFNGSSNYVNCGSSNSLNITEAITIEAWIKKYGWGNSNYPRIVDKYPAPCMYLHHFGDLCWYGEIGGESVDEHICEDVLVDNEWQQLVLSYNNEDHTIRGYVNGEPKGSCDKYSGNLSTTANPLIVGNRESLDRAYYGLFGSLRIFKVCLTDEVIKELFNLTYRRW